MDCLRKAELLEELVRILCKERQIKYSSDINEAGLWDTFRALVNTRPPHPVSQDWLSMQDELLSGLIIETGITHVNNLEPVPVDSRIRLWRGDITTLAADAIVNAANSQMLGCWVPGHFCIDNSIHTFAGVQLRAECARIMDAQGHEEPTGCAKKTSAYNLPSKFVIHTVGPIANGAPTNTHRQQLTSCYRSCLNLAQQAELSSIAFCCISTGVFGFPQREAAQIAVSTVREWLDTTESQITVVFNVFTVEDLKIYSNLLGL